MMEELELSEEYFEDTWAELEQARGEKLIEAKKKRRKKSAKANNNLEEIILTFEDTDGLDIEETYSISIKAESVVSGKNDKNGKFKSVAIGKLKENRLLEYIAMYIDDSSGSILTLAFENGYSIEISGSPMIEKLK